MPEHYLKYKKGSKEYKKAYKEHLKTTADQMLRKEDEKYKDPEALKESVKKGSKYGAFAGAVGGSAYSYGKHKGRGSTVQPRKWKDGGPFDADAPDGVATKKYRDKGESVGTQALTGGVSGVVGGYVGAGVGYVGKKLKDKYKLHKRVRKLKKSGYGLPGGIGG